MTAVERELCLLEILMIRSALSRIFGRVDDDIREDVRAVSQDLDQVEGKLYERLVTS